MAPVKEHHSKTVNNIDASQVKDDDRVICLGTLDKERTARHFDLERLTR